MKSTQSKHQQKIWLQPQTRGTWETTTISSSAQNRRGMCALLNARFQPIRQQLAAGIKTRRSLRCSATATKSTQAPLPSCTYVPSVSCGDDLWVPQASQPAPKVEIQSLHSHHLLPVMMYVYSIWKVGQPDSLALQPLPANHMLLTVMQSVLTRCLASMAPASASTTSDLAENLPVSGHPQLVEAC